MSRTDSLPARLPGLAGMLAVALVAGCATGTSTNDDSGAASSAPTATVVLSPTEGNQVNGTVTFTRTQAGIKVVAEISGLAPGEHGFHIHEIGDCSAPDAMSAGGHFNPMSTPHAGPDMEMRHVGDLGNLTADADGHARLERTDMHLSFEGPTSIIGRAVIVHADPDDMTTQPTGGAGARVACGVIGPVTS